MAINPCHGVCRTKEGPGHPYDVRYEIEMLMHRALATLYHCHLALKQFVMGGARTDVNAKKEVQKWLQGTYHRRVVAMVNGSCHGVRRTKEGLGHPQDPEWCENAYA